MALGCYVVTGASAGIGLAVALSLLNAGEQVLVIARNASRLHSLFDAYHNAHILPLDLLQVNQVQVIADALKSFDAKVKGFVHCAGFNQLAPLSLVSSAVAHSLYQLHVVFPMEFLGWLGKKNNHIDGAACVLVGSLAARCGASGNGMYASAKAAVESLTKSAAAELASRGVRVNAVVLGVVETNLFKDTLAHLGWSEQQISAEREKYPLGFGSAENVAEVISFLLSDGARWITGSSLVVDGGRSL